MVSFGQKLKWPKTCEKRFYEHIRVVLCKKSFIKTPNIRQMRAFWKVGDLAKAIDFAKWSVWVKKLKWKKTCEKRFYEHIRVVLCKKPLIKTPNIRQMRAF